MDKVIELELELRDGGSYYLCDSKFSVMSGKIRRHVNAVESYYQDYASVMVLLSSRPMKRWSR